MSHFNTNSRSGLVQSTSVTSQFNSLNVDRDSFRKSKNAALKSHDAIQAQILELTKQRDTFLAHNRAEQEVLGTHSRKRDMHLQKKLRLNRVMENERKALEACAKHFQSLQDDANQATLRYFSEVGEINAQIASTMEKELRHKQVSLVSVESVAAVVLQRRPAHLKGSLAEAIQVLQNAKKCLGDAQDQRKTFASKLEDYSSGPGEVHGRPSMDLFYGLEHSGDTEMAY